MDGIDKIDFPVKILKSEDELKFDLSIKTFIMNIKDKDPESLVQLAKNLAIDISTHSEKTRGAIKDVKSCMPVTSAVFDQYCKKSKRLDPYVGAVAIIKKNKGCCLYGSCRGAVDGDSHAEYTLLTQLLDHFESSLFSQDDIFVSTLEPCTPESRHAWSTSCSKALVDRGIKKVVMGIFDPNPDVMGFGYKYLTDHGVDVTLFSSTEQKIIKEDNKFFIRQFDDGDPRVNRAAYLTLEPYLDFRAVDYYCKAKYSKEVKDFDKQRFSFLRDMIMSRFVLKQDFGDIEEYQPLPEFALFFFAKPQEIVDGSQIVFHKGIYDPADGGYDEAGSNVRTESVYYSGPLCFAYDGLPKEYGEPSEPCFLEEFLRKYDVKFPSLGLNHHLSREALEDELQEYVMSKGGTLNSNLLREVFTNAIAHRDYASGGLTVVEFGEDRFTVRSPVSFALTDDALNSFSYFTRQSNPGNPKLMRLFQDCSLAERDNYGMVTLRNYRLRNKDRGIFFEKRDNYLVTTIML